MEKYVILILDSCDIVTIFLNLWMSRSGHETFAFTHDKFHQFTIGTLPCHNGDSLKLLIWLELQWQHRSRSLFHLTNCWTNWLPLWRMRMAICPSLLEFSPLWSNVFLWWLQLLGKDLVLALLLVNHANIIVVIQMFMWAFVRLVWKPHNLLCKKELHGEKSQAKDVLIGKWHVVMQTSPIKNWKP